MGGGTLSGRNELQVVWHPLSSVELHIGAEGMVRDADQSYSRVGDDDHPDTIRLVCSVNFQSSCVPVPRTTGSSPPSPRCNQPSNHCRVMRCPHVDHISTSGRPQPCDAAAWVGHGSLPPTLVNRPRLTAPHTLCVDSTHSPVWGVLVADDRRRPHVTAARRCTHGARSLAIQSLVGFRLHATAHASAAATGCGRLGGAAQGDAGEVVRGAAGGGAE